MFHYTRRRQSQTQGVTPWIRSAVKEIMEVSSCPVLPSIQVRPDYPDDLAMSTADFKAAVEAALAPHSRGVVFWSWEHLAKEPEKLAVLERLLSKH